MSATEEIENIKMSIYLQSFLDVLSPRNKGFIFPYLENGQKRFIDIKEDYKWKTKQLVEIENIAQGQRMILDVLQNQFSVNAAENVKILVRIWRYFWGLQERTWNVESDEWVIANQWLNWILDYCLINKIDKNNVVKNLGIVLYKVEDYKIKLESSSKPLHFGCFDVSDIDLSFATNFYNDIVSKIENMVYEKVQDFVENTFSFDGRACVNQKVYSNKMYQIYVDNVGLWKNKRDMQYEVLNKYLDECFCVVLVGLRQKLKNYMIDFNGITQGLQLVEKSRKDKVIFEGIPVTEEEYKDILNGFNRLYNSYMEYVELDKNNNHIVKHIFREYKSIKDSDLKRLTKLLFKFITKYFLYWRGIDKTVKCDFQEISEKNVIEGLDYTIYVVIENEIKSILRMFYLYKNWHEHFRMRQYIKKTGKEQIQKEICEMNEYVDVAKNEILEVYVINSSKTEIKNKLIKSLSKCFLNLSNSDIAIIQAIINHPEYTYKEIAGVTGYSLYTIEERIPLLEQKGVIKGKQNGIWTFW